MAANPHDPRPQAVIRTVKGTGTTEPRGAYVDPALTTRNQTAKTVDPDPDKTEPSDTGNVRRFYAGDQVREVDQTATNPGVDPAPQSKPLWEIETTADGVERSKDPYRNDGMISQNDTFKNQG